MASVGDLELWAESVGLAPDALRILQEEGFTNLSQVGLLTPEVINEFFMKTRRLPLAQCLALQKATTQLKTSSLSPPSEATPNELEQGECSDPESMSSTVPHQELAIGGLSQLTLHSDCNANVSTLRLLLVGITGSGKSTTGNTILGGQYFTNETGFGSVTGDCQLRQSLYEDVNIEIMDSPGLFDTRSTNDVISTTIVKAVAGMHPGFHAFLYVITISRFTEEDEGVYTRLETVFDKALQNYIIVVFTGGDDLERAGKSIQTILRDAPGGLRKILKDCKNRYVVFNNNAPNKKPQVDLLLRKVQTLVTENGGVPYTCKKYLKINEAIEEEVTRRLAGVEKRALKRNRYVQKLEANIKKAESDLKREKVKFHLREQARQQQMEEEREMNRVQLESLKQMLEQQNLTVEKKRLELDTLKQKLERERVEMKREMEKRREQELKDLQEKEATAQKGIAEKESEIREERKKLQEEEQKRVHETQRLRYDIAENKDSRLRDCFKQLLNVAVDIASDHVIPWALRRHFCH